LTPLFGGVRGQRRDKNVGHEWQPLHTVLACAAATPRLRFVAMATWADVRRIALALPQTSERSSRGISEWCVKDKGFVWERPLRTADRAALGDRAPEGPILGARVEHVGIKEVLLANNPDAFFTTPHFDGYPAILVRLDRIAVDELDDLIVDAWLAKAPKRLAADYLATLRGR
jgi:hypothetical protein